MNDGDSLCKPSLLSAEGDSEVSQKLKHSEEESSVMTSEAQARLYRNQIPSCKGLLLATSQLTGSKQ